MPLTADEVRGLGSAAPGLPGIPAAGARETVLGGVDDASELGAEEVAALRAAVDERAAAVAEPEWPSPLLDLQDALAAGAPSGQAASGRLTVAVDVWQLHAQRAVPADPVAVDAAIHQLDGEWSADS
jgi:hypothetical protein